MIRALYRVYLNLKALLPGRADWLVIPLDELRVVELCIREHAKHFEQAELDAIKQTGLKLGYYFVEVLTFPNHKEIAFTPKEPAIPCRNQKKAEDFAYRIRQLTAIVRPDGRYNLQFPVKVEISPFHNAWNKMALALSWNLHMAPLP